MIIATASGNTTFLYDGDGNRVRMKAKPQHELWVFRWSTKVRGVLVSNEVIYEGEVNYLVDLAKEMVLRNNLIV